MCHVGGQKKAGWFMGSDVGLVAAIFAEILKKGEEHEKRDETEGV